MGRARSNSNLSSNESLALGVAVTDDMDSERMVAYRAQYQQFRRGEAHGADGEQPSEDAALRPALEDEGDPHSSVSETAAVRTSDNISGDAKFVQRAKFVRRSHQQEV